MLQNITKKEISKIIKKFENEPLQKQENPWYIEEKETKYKRLYFGNYEITLILNEQIGSYLYFGVAYFDGEKKTYSTVTRLKEGRREDTLEVNGAKANFALLIANRIKSNTVFFKTC